jgi:DNA repair exonuclease SbcCD nuclease subunit
MTIKFLYMTDPHMKGKSPSTRIDDFPTTIEMKVRDFFAYGHEMGVDFFMCGGDFMDSPYTSTRYVKKIGKIFKECLKGKELFFVWGNHDVVAWNPKTIEDTSFGLFEAFTDEFVLLTEVPIVRVYNGQSIALSGISSYARLDRTIEVDGEPDLHRSRDYIVEDTYGMDNVPRVHVVHGYLSPKPILEDIPHTVIDEMKDTKAAITLTGHEHTGFPVKQLTHGLVYNPGALGRVFASHTEMNRTPKYALCEIAEDGTPSIQPVESRVAKLGVEVMDRTLLDEKKARAALLEATQGGIREVLAQIKIEKVDLRTIITRFQGEVKPEVYTETKRRLGL